MEFKKTLDEKYRKLNYFLVECKSGVLSDFFWGIGIVIVLEESTV